MPGGARDVYANQRLKNIVWENGEKLESAFVLTVANNNRIELATRPSRTRPGTTQWYDIPKSINGQIPTRIIPSCTTTKQRDVIRIQGVVARGSSNKLLLQITDANLLESHGLVLGVNPSSKYDVRLLGAELDARGSDQREPPASTGEEGEEEKKDDEEEEEEGIQQNDKDKEKEKEGKQDSDCDDDETGDETQHGGEKRDVQSASDSDEAECDLGALPNISEKHAKRVLPSESDSSSSAASSSSASTTRKRVVQQDEKTESVKAKRNRMNKERRLSEKRHIESGAEGEDEEEVDDSKYNSGSNTQGDMETSRSPSSVGQVTGEVEEAKDEGQGQPEAIADPSSDVEEMGEAEDSTAPPSSSLSRRLEGMALLKKLLPYRKDLEDLEIVDFQKLQELEDKNPRQRELTYDDPSPNTSGKRSYSASGTKSKSVEEEKKALDQPATISLLDRLWLSRSLSQLAADSSSSEAKAVPPSPSAAARPQASSSRASPSKKKADTDELKRIAHDLPDIRSGWEEAPDSALFQLVTAVNKPEGLDMLVSSEEKAIQTLQKINTIGNGLTIANLHLLWVKGQFIMTVRKKGLDQKDDWSEFAGLFKSTATDNRVIRFAKACNKYPRLRYLERDPTWFYTNVTKLEKVLDECSEDIRQQWKLL